MIPFLKMHGLGNDFVVIDNREGKLPAFDWGKIADRNRGIGCDQVVVLEKSTRADVFMRIFNADASEVESCGNASRCIAWLVFSEKAALGKSVTIEILAGFIEAQVQNADTITMDMGAPKTKWQDIPLSKAQDTLHLEISQEELSDPVAVNVGNPHAVFFVSDAYAVPLHVLGPLIENNPLFPARANIGVVQVESAERLNIRVWERGSGLTLACGTGACAALVAAHLRGLTGRKAQVKLPGGELLIEWREQDDHVLMTGPAKISYQGEFDEREYSA